MTASRRGRPESRPLPAPRVAWMAVLAAAGCSLFVRPDRQPTAPADVVADPGDEAPPAEVPIYVRPIDRSAIAPLASASPYWDKVRRGEPLFVGVNPGYPPIAVRTRDDGWDGFGVDLGRHLGQTLGVPVVFVAVAPHEAAERIVNGEVDIAISGLTLTAYRAAQVNFSEAYLTISQAALVERRLVEGARGTDEEQRRNSLQSYLDLRQITGVRIGAARETRPHRLALRFLPSAKVVAFPTIEAASQALIRGEVQAIVHDEPYIRMWPHLHPAASGRFKALLEPVTRESLAMAIRKGDLEFLTWLDAYIEELKETGSLDRLYRRHFVDKVWLEDAVLVGGEQ